MCEKRIDRGAAAGAGDMAQNTRNLNLCSIDNLL